MRPRAKQSGFSLIELSIVLVILGLLVGGVLAGQSLIRAAELRAVSTEYARYSTAVQTFRDKYFALPGDMSNATAFWGKDNTRCAGDSGAVATPGTCNGNGDGRITYFVENYRYWQQLAMAGLIEGSYSGFVNPVANTTPPARGRDVPASKIDNAMWMQAYLSQLTTTNVELGFSGVSDTYNNYLMIISPVSGWWVGNAVFKPEEAWNIDTKMDDGRPAFGKVRGGIGNGTPNGIICFDVTTAAAQYALATGTKGCILGFIID